MDRRRASLVLLLVFVLCTGIAIVISGSRPGLEQGLAPALVQFVGYACGLAGAVLLFSSTTEPEVGAPRRIGGVVLGALVVLVLLDLLGADGTNIGAGFVRLVLLVVIMVATIRLALGVAAAGRPR
ncbi:hypothetical protein E4P40_17095 [Blastococcus sp. CT_GayMR20]|uniref:hypothetical protein n=1 Tax=Blastococcus sp. CT_GayMR20 TaxID=2559609 RepID=UPI001073DC0C|nr:hypothetical protein [Blastococcus sp. CT_GayMR20]TFV81124.1 hypothetical protein E4P40_17030 [Blastococcus sp. CT_GayMR20]TFV81136.1 hypothetical protein E4P40_17095 [Blastococcus sp. CT_GayMR20]